MKHPWWSALALVGIAVASVWAIRKLLSYPEDPGRVSDRWVRDRRREESRDAH